VAQNRLQVPWRLMMEIHSNCLLCRHQLKSSPETQHNESIVWVKTVLDMKTLEGEAAPGGTINGKAEVTGGVEVGVHGAGAEASVHGMPTLVEEVEAAVDDKDEVQLIEGVKKLQLYLLLDCLRMCMMRMFGLRLAKKVLLFDVPL